MNYTVTFQSFQALPSSDHIGFSVFQYGEMPTPTNNYMLTSHSVPPDTDSVKIFFFDPSQPQVIPPGNQVRFNLHIQVNTHNARDVQIRINSDHSVDWRWGDPDGCWGGWYPWGQGIDSQNWFDETSNYLIYLQGQSPTDLYVYIGQSTKPAGRHSVLIPKRMNVPENVLKYA